MGRPSKLTDAQWEQINKRLLAGEKSRALAREFKIGESTIRERFSDAHGKIKSVANQLVAVDAALNELPVSAQLSAISLAQELKAMSMHLASAGKYGAATAHRLAGMAHHRVAQIDTTMPLDDKSMETLKGVAALTRLANDASQIAVSLIAANKDTMKKAGETPPETPAALINDPMEASRVYQELMART